MKKINANKFNTSFICYCDVHVQNRDERVLPMGTTRRSDARQSAYNDVNCTRRQFLCFLIRKCTHVAIRKSKNSDYYYIVRAIDMCERQEIILSFTTFLYDERAQFEAAAALHAIGAFICTVDKEARAHCKFMFK